MSRRPGVFSSRRKAAISLGAWATVGLALYVAMVVFAGFLWHEADEAGRHMAAAASAAEAQP